MEERKSRREGNTASFYLLQTAHSFVFSPWRHRGRHRAKEQRKWRRGGNGESKTKSTTQSDARKEEKEPKKNHLIRGTVDPRSQSTLLAASLWDKNRGVPLAILRPRHGILRRFLSFYKMVIYCLKHCILFIIPSALFYSP
jgi:hypothetical protein